MLHKPTNADWTSAKQAIKDYGAARKKFRAAQERLRHCGLLQGNDNKVGAAGEFWAIQYYCSKGYRIVEVPCSNNAGYDFRCRKGSECDLRVSVKVVTDESVKGTQLPLKKSNMWDVLFVVLLSEKLLPYRRGFATRRDFERARRAKAIGETPQIARRSLNPRGWIGTYGEVEDWEIKQTLQLRSRLAL